jgi:hypothetical protein
VGSSRGSVVLRDAEIIKRAIDWLRVQPFIPEKKEVFDAFHRINEAVQRLERRHEKVEKKSQDKREQVMADFEEICVECQLSRNLILSGTRDTLAFNQRMTMAQKLKERGHRVKYIGYAMGRCSHGVAYYLNPEYREKKRKRSREYVKGSKND